MTVNMTLKLTGIDGESQKVNHENEIDILSFGWGLTQSGTTHTGTGSGSGQVDVQDLSVVKYVDKSTPALHIHCAHGKHIDEGILTIYKAGDEDAPVDYMKFTLGNIIVTAISSGGSGGEDQFTESVSFNFRTIKYEYVPQSEKGAKEGGSEFGFDIAANTSL